jgi:uncharacterized protein (DUF302 family)
MIRNLFAFIGFVAVIAVIAVAIKLQGAVSGFDPGAAGVYTELAQNLLKTKSSAQATVWKVPVEEGVSAEDVEEAMKMVANEINMAKVAELPLSKDIEAKSGKPYRVAKIFMFCNSLTAARMMDYDDAFSAYLPCRITLVEDKSGKLWLYSLNMDLMIHGGAPLPPELKEEAIKVKEAILTIMKRGAAGDF